MKKILLTVAAVFVNAALFAGTPAKDFLAGVYDFATKESSTWKIYDGNFSSIDATTEEYVFTGGFVVKLLTSSRYDFVCKVTNNENDFTLELSDVVSYACDKSGSKLGSAKVMKTSAKVVSQYAAQMKTEISSRIEALQKSGNIESEYTKIVSSPAFVKVASKSMSDLAMKKFVEENINGKTVNFEVKLASVDENVNPITGKTEALAYKARGTVEVYKDGTPGLLVLTEPYSIYIYSNNEKLLSAKIGSAYSVNGRARLSQIGVGMNKYWSYHVDEE
ncbi:MAG: hypothetical protein KBT11_09495 [Treponema sp.]|nr:hypothetical protein [Candidatus Treponema equifaecale]